jgi:hypothetical protein
LFHEFITSLWPIKQLSPLGAKYGRCIVKSSFSANFNHYRCFLARKLCHKTGGIC